MNNESLFFTVTHITVPFEGQPVIAHTDYTSDQKNAAMAKYHELAKYAREVGNLSYFCTYISNQWGGVEVKDEATFEPVNNEGDN